MTDPYKVLGISRNAGTDEIKKAYRTLSRKYHPDANIDNPNKEQAEEMFKLVQQAYKQIMDEKEGKTSYDSYGQQGFGGFGGAYQQEAYGESEEDVRLRAASNYVNNRMYREALNVLNDLSGRSARWYYLHAVANYGLGNNINAVQDAQQAVNLEPSNYQYRQFLQVLQGRGQWYTDMGESYGYERGGEGIGSFCCKCLALNLFCNCCC